jgi:hypothetical protein
MTCCRCSFSKQQIYDNGTANASNSDVNSERHRLDRVVARSQRGHCSQRLKTMTAYWPSLSASSHSESHVMTAMLCRTHLKQATACTTTGEAVCIVEVESDQQLMHRGQTAFSWMLLLVFNLLRVIL